MRKLHMHMKRWHKLKYIHYARDEGNGYSYCYDFTPMQCRQCSNYAIQHDDNFVGQSKPVKLYCTACHWHIHVRYSVIDGVPISLHWSKAKWCYNPFTIMRQRLEDEVLFNVRKEER